VARRLVGSRATTQIVFVTAYDQHAIEAFEVNAVDYLLKPVDQSRLETAVDRARRRVASDRPVEAGTNVNSAELEKIIQAVAERQSRRERLAIKVGERYLLVQAEEIIYASLADEGITVVPASTRGRRAIVRWTNCTSGSTRPSSGGCTARTW